MKRNSINQNEYASFLDIFLSGVLFLGDKGIILKEILKYRKMDGQSGSQQHFRYIECILYFQEVLIRLI